MERGGRGQALVGAMAFDQQGASNAVSKKWNQVEPELRIRGSRRVVRAPARTTPDPFAVR